MSRWWPAAGSGSLIFFFLIGDSSMTLLYGCFVILFFLHFIFKILNSVFILYWSIVDLQCCVSFRYTAK